MDVVAGVIIEKLSKSFAGLHGETVTAVAALDLMVSPGELLVLVGPSGCGKTTLLRLIAGLERPGAGTIAIGGRCMNGVPPQDRNVAMVFQNHALFPHLSIYENLAFGLRLRKVPRAETDARVREVARMLGLEECLKRRPRELSGGQCQRAALGRALVRRPQLLLLDEPLSSLDAPLRLELRAELTRLHRQLGMTVIYVTHDQAEALALGDRVAAMRDGAVRQVAPPLELYQRPADLWVAQFIGSPPMNLLRGTLLEKSGGVWFRANPPATLELRLDPASPPPRQVDGAGSKQVVLGLRPEDILRVGLAEEPVRPTIEAVVDLVQPLGAETHLYLTADGCSLVARVPASDTSRPLDKLTLRFDLGRARLFDPASGQAV